MLRRHFMMAGFKPEPDYIITYYANLKVPFIGGKKTKNLTMWETGTESEPLAEFKVVSDTYYDGYGLWGIKTSNPTAYYGLILDLHNNTYYADSGNPDSITGIIFPEGITHIHGSILNNISTQTSLEDVTIPISTTSLTGNLFGNYNGLTSITVPYNVTRIDNLCSVSTNDTYTNTSLEEIILQPLTPPDASLSNNHPLGIYDSEYTKDNFKIRVYVDAINNYRTDAIWSLYSDLYDTINNAICYTSTNGDEISTSINGIHTKQNNRWVLTTDTDTIPKKAFYSNSYLQAIAIPSNIISINPLAFHECSSLKSIVVAEGNTVYDSREDCNAIIETATNTLIAGCQNTIIPDSVTKIGAGAFEDVPKDIIIIPEQIIDVGEDSLKLRGLSSVIWNAKRCNNFKWMTYGNYAFGPQYGKKILLTLGDSVERLPHLFSQSLSTESFIIPDSVKYLGLTSVPSTSHLVIGQGVRRVYSPILNSGATSVVWNVKNLHQDTEDIFSETARSAIKSFDFGANITTIPDHLCLSCTQLSSVVIPNNVITIGRYAFEDCSSLTSVTIPESVTSIGLYAFADCSSLTSITIPNSVTSIEDVAFYDCSSLTSVTIGNSVTSIEDRAFLGCSSLTSITIPNSVTKIGMHAFRSCSGLTSITIPNSVTSIGGYAFYDCSALESVTIPNSVTSIGDLAFHNCKSLTSITIPNSVTSIGKYAFEDCSSLASITIPNSVTSIGNRAFYGCASLQKTNINDITAWCNISFESADASPIYQSRNLYINDNEISELVIPATVDTIRTYVFLYCSTLTSVTISEGVKSIEKEAFSKCANLASIAIPTSVISIGDKAFYNSKFYNDNSNWNNDVLYINDCLIKSNTINAVILDNTRLIADRAFYNLGVTAITIPNSVTCIGEEAFAKCSELTNITIPDSVTNIGKYAFHDCSSLTSPIYNAHLFALMPISYVGEYAIPEGIEQIIPEAFADCESLTSIIIPNSMISIGDYAFLDCSSLTSVTIPNSVTSIGESAFEGCSSLTSVTIPNSVTSIGAYAFSDCSSLASITIPNSVTSIGSYAFEDCSALESVTIPDSVTQIKRSAFRDCSSLTSITIPNSVTSIGNSVFSSCSGLTSITIPNSVTSIGDYVFYECSNLSSITIPENVTSIGDCAFADCSSLTSITIPEGVTSIEYSAFAGCSSLRSITIPNSVTSIGTYAFSRCSSLSSVTIGNSVKSIGDNAFYRCSSLESVTIPNSVTSIGDNAFYDCKLLTNIIYNGTMEEWDAIQIILSNNNLPKTCIVHCTDGDIPIAEA